MFAVMFTSALGASVGTEVNDTESSANSQAKYDGAEMPCAVIKDENGMHRIKEASITEFKGWRDA